MADEIEVSQVLAQVLYQEPTWIAVSQLVIQVEYEEGSPAVTVQPTICVIS